MDVVRAAYVPRQTSAVLRSVCCEEAATSGRHRIEIVTLHCHRVICRLFSCFCKFLDFPTHCSIPVCCGKQLLCHLFVGFVNGDPLAGRASASFRAFRSTSLSVTLSKCFSCSACEMYSAPVDFAPGFQLYSSVKIKFVEGNDVCQDFSSRPVAADRFVFCFLSEESLSGTSVAQLQPVHLHTLVHLLG